MCSVNMDDIRCVGWVEYICVEQIGVRTCQVHVFIMRKSLTTIRRLDKKTDLPVEILVRVEVERGFALSNLR